MTNIIYPSPLAEEISYEQIKDGLKIHNPYGAPEVAHNRCCDEAIKCIEKLEKIEQIIKDHDADRMPEDYWYIDKIKEVIEGGNDD